MAEPSNSDTVTESNPPAGPEDDSSAPDTTATSVQRVVPVKASPLQKSFLERRKTREATKTADGAAGRSTKSAAAKAVDRVDLQKSPTDSDTVRRAAADRAALTRIGVRLLAGVVLVAVLAAAVLFGIGKYRYDQREELRAEYSSFAQQVTVNLTTLTPSNVGQLQKTLLEQTSGYAKQQMEQAVKQTVELVKQGQLSTKTTVLSTAVTRAEPDRGSAIMVFGWTSKPKDPSQETAVETYRWRVDMTRINGQLKLTNFEWVW